jgi:hypothetical protein
MTWLPLPLAGGGWGVGLSQARHARPFAASQLVPSREREGS